MSAISSIWLHVWAQRRKARYGETGTARLRHFDTEFRRRKCSDEEAHALRALQIRFMERCGRRLGLYPGAEARINKFRCLSLESLNNSIGDLFSAEQWRAFVKKFYSVNPV